MNNFYRPTKRIKVCTGPGCKSWQSGKVLSLLWRVIGKSPGTGNIQVSPMPCVNKCSGGVTVEMSPSGELLKCREPEEALEILTQQNTSCKNKNFREGYQRIEMSKK